MDEGIGSIFFLPTPTASVFKRYVVTVATFVCQQQHQHQHQLPTPIQAAAWKIMMNFQEGLMAGTSVPFVFAFVFAHGPVVKYRWSDSISLAPLICSLFSCPCSSSLGCPWRGCCSSSWRGCLIHIVLLPLCCWARNILATTVLPHPSLLPPLPAPLSFLRIVLRDQYCSQFQWCTRVLLL